MDLSLLKILGYLNVLIFLIVMFIKRGSKNRTYIIYILLSYPFLAIPVLPVANGFEFITYVFYFIFYKKPENRIRIDSIYRILFVVLICSVAAGLFFSDEKIDLDNVTNFTAILPLFIFSKLLIDECLLDVDFFYTVTKSLKVILIFGFVFLFGQLIVGVGLSLSKIQNPNIIINNAIRYPGFLSDPQTFAQYLGMMSFITLIIKDEEKSKAWNYLLIALGLISIMLTGARAGIMGWMAGVLLLMVFIRRYRIKLLLTSALLLLLAINYQDYFAIFQRSGDLGETYEFRNTIWNDAYNIFLNYPFLGIGLANYSRYVAVHHSDQFWIVENEYMYFDHPESGYLKFLTELGIIGFISILFLLLYPVMKGLIIYLKTKDDSFILLSSAVICFMVGFYSTFSMGDVRISLLVVTVLSLLVSKYQSYKAYSYNINPSKIFIKEKESSLYAKINVN